METNKIVVIRIYAVTQIVSQGTKEIKDFLSNKNNIHGRILFTLRDYLTKYSKTFSRVRFSITDEVNYLFPNGTLKGIIGMINRSEIDIGVQPLTMHEVTTDIVDFSFPYELLSATFVTKKAEYKPHILGILQTFSFPLWIAIISILMAMSLVYYVYWKKRYSFDKILLHTFAVLLRQSSILNPSSVIENMLIFSWVVGAMFLCLAYDSIFLSFLAFPSINQVEDVPHLAKAVKDGQYFCQVTPNSAILQLLLKSKNENLKIIGQNVLTNNLTTRDTFQDFLRGRSKQNLAYLVDTNVVNILAVGNKFVSEDHFLENMAAMPIRKNFCCKKLMEKFVHRFLASGLYFKYQSDRELLLRLPCLLEYEEKDTSKRKLTLIDVAPAFIFLIFGQIISFLVLIAEIFLNYKKKVNLLKKNGKRRMRIAYKEGST